MLDTRYTLDDLKAMVGRDLGVSAWHVVDQARVSDFAGVTEDFQFIHVDTVRAAATPFGGTIAHGFLLLSLLSVFFYEAVDDIAGVSTSINYGFDSVRFITPIRTGKRIRGRFLLQNCIQRNDDRWKLSVHAVVEIEGIETPALVADWLIMVFADTNAAAISP